MPRLLLITAAFPPTPGGASDQMGKRVKYLQRAGWEVCVLTPDFGADSAGDPRTVVADGAEVHRTGYLFQSTRSSLRHDKQRPRAARRRMGGLTDLLFVAAGYLRWFPSAIRTGCRLGREVDAIVSVSNPITTHAVARAVARGCDKPWIAELRDPLVGYSYSRRGPELLNRWIEAWLVRRADGIVQWRDFVPEPVADRHPGAADKFLVISHTGYDADDFVDFVRRDPRGGPLKICYTGSFYGDAITPVPFLRALGAHLSRSDSVPVEAVFAGDWSPDYAAVLDRLDLDHCVRSLGRIPRADCIRLWQQSHVLLLVLGATGDDVDRIPSKFWDYVATGAVLLALAAPEGRVAELVRSQGLGRVVAPTDVEGIQAAIADLAATHLRGRLAPHPSDEFLAAATKQHGESMLSDFIRGCAGLLPG